MVEVAWWRRGRVVEVAGLVLEVLVVVVGVVVGVVVVVVSGEDVLVDESAAVAVAVVVGTVEEPDAGAPAICAI